MTKILPNHIDFNVLYKKIDQSICGNPLGGSCANYAVALARNIQSDFIICSYSNADLFPESPSHCGVLYCPTMPRKMIPENCNVIYDATGQITSDRLKEWAIEDAKEMIKEDPTFDFNIQLLVTDLKYEGFTGFRDIYDENKMKNINIVIENYLKQ